jgi:hypothetical protein
MNRPCSDIKADGSRWYHTGKIGTHLATGTASAEYDNGRGERLWADYSGRILSRNA